MAWRFPDGVDTLGLDDLLRMAHEVGYGAGEWIFRRGDPPRFIYVVMAGAAQLSGMQTRRRIGVEVFRPGDLFGHNALLSGTPHSFDAHALEATKLLAFRSDSVRARLRQRPDLLRGWLALVNDQAIRLQRRLVDTLAGPLEHRLARFLAGQAARGELGLTQGELADLLGVHRATVNRALKDLEEAGVITTGYRRITVTDPAGLARVAREPRAIHTPDGGERVVGLRTRGRGSRRPARRPGH